MYNLPFIGNLTRDLELVTNTKSGTPRLNFSIAVNEGERGTDSEKVNFFSFTAFGEVAENASKSFSKGDRVMVIARAGTYNKDVQIDGDDKSLTLHGFTATDIGASMRFATAEITRTPKKTKSESSFNEDEPAKKAPAKKAAAKAAPAEEDDDF